MKFNNKKFAADMITYRTAKKVTLRDMSAKTGVPLSTLYRIEAAQYPDVEQAYRIAKVIGKKVDTYIR